MNYSKYGKFLTNMEHNLADLEMENCDEHMTVTELECQTIVKQRKELQLLIGELKDRDKELNDMVSTHRQQLAAWEKDRQKLIYFEKRNTKLETEIRKRNEQLRMLVHRLKQSESDHCNNESILEATQTQLAAAQKAVDRCSVIQHDLESSNDKLNESVSEMSEKIERLEAKEQDYITQLQLKNGELVEAESEISELNNKLRRYEAELKQIAKQESVTLGDLEQQRNKFRQCRAELDKTTAETATKTGEIIALRQETAKIRDEVQKLREELYLAEEQLKRREEVIQLQKSKQQRSDVEMANLRHLYERQQEELAVLQMNLESSQQMLTKQEEKLNMLNMNQLCLDKLDTCSQTTNDLLDEARQTVNDNSFLYQSSSPSTPCHYTSYSVSGPTESYSDKCQSQIPTTRCTSTAKLQKLICESKQMARNLEKSVHSPTTRSASYY